MRNWQPTSYSTAKTKNVSFKIGNKTRMSTFTSLIQDSTGALTGWAQLVECRCTRQRVAGLIPFSQSTCLGCRFSPRLGHVWAAADWCFFLTSIFVSLSPSLLLSLKINEIFKKKKRVLEVLPTAIRQEEEIKSIQIGKEVTVIICRWHDIVYREP